MHKIFFILVLVIFAKADVITKAINLVKIHEGYVGKPYLDNGHFSIGYGLNLSYITKDEAELLLRYRLKANYKKLSSHPWFCKLSSQRKVVVLDMSYQLGIPKLLHFKHFIWRLKNEYYHGAANAMKDSLWCKQSGTRCKRLYKIMFYNTYETK